MHDPLMITHTVEFAAERRKYPIFIGAGLLKNPGLFRPLVRKQRLVVLTDYTTEKLFGQTLRQTLAAAGALKIDSLSMDFGEKAKSLPHYIHLIEDILNLGVDRSTILVALGGGVVGDLCGFCAATLLRGVRFIQIPTTLLSQIDSSVGGKTGLNSAFGKNLIGAFWQPTAVVADTECLKTLSPRLWRAGYGELIKYGLIGNPAFFVKLEEKDFIAEGRSFEAADSPFLENTIAEAIRYKAALVEADEKETSQRALLNLGHTFGHAFEAAANFDEEKLLHGEAVALGILCAFCYSVLGGVCRETDFIRIRNHFQARGLPTSLRNLKDPSSPERILSLMRHDKKSHEDRIRLILPRDIGHSFMEDRPSENRILETLTVMAAN